jgi:hypothetical protein
VTGGGPGSWDSNLGFKVYQSNNTSDIVGLSGSYVNFKHVDVMGPSMDNDGRDAFQINDDNITISYVYTHGIGLCPFMSTGGDIIVEYSHIGTFGFSWIINYPSDHSEIASIWSFSGAVGNHTFRHNLFTWVYSTGGLMWDNSDNHAAVLAVYGNVFYNISGDTWNYSNGCIGGWTGGGGEDCYTMRIYNNTFIDISGKIFTDFIIRSGDNIAYNNLFYNSGNIGYADIQTHDYNHYINSGGTYSEANGTSAASGDPFVGYTALDFALLAATTAGKNDLGSPYNIDPLGVTRGTDGTWDRGAYEYNAGSPPVDPNKLIMVLK